MRRRKELALDDPLLRDAMAVQAKVFATRFGRAPTAEDRVFFCWHASTPRPMCELCFAEYERAIVRAAEKTGVDPGRALRMAGVDDPLGTLKITN